MDTSWSRYIQGCKTLYSSRRLRFHDRFRHRFAELFTLEDRPMRILEVNRPIFHFSVVMQDHYDGEAVYK